jgi:serine protease Do
MAQYKQLIKRNKPSVVSVAFGIPTLGQTEQGKQNIDIKVAGSGFFVSKDGYICTCNHLLQGGQGQLLVGVKQNGDYTFLPAQIILTDQERDVAILHLPNIDKKKVLTIPAVTLGDSNVLGEGDEVLFIGFPFGGQTGGGFSPSSTHGIISAMRPRKIGNVDITFFQIDALTLEGNSGAPVFDAEGKVIGVINSRFDPMMMGNIPQVIIGGRPLGISTNIGFAIPINLVKPLIKAALEKTT